MVTPDHGSCKGAHEQNKQQGLPAQEGADHGQELDIPAAHAFALRDELIEKGNAVQNAPADEKTQKSVTESEAS